MLNIFNNNNNNNNNNNKNNNNDNNNKYYRQNLLTVAHIGDSKACIARRIDGRIQPEWLTIDHKPNMPNELQRIQNNGGSLAWLHGNKPFIR